MLYNIKKVFSTVLLFGIILLVGIALTFSPVTAQTTQKQEWINRTVDTEGDLAGGISLELDENYNPHISYRNTTGDNLKYAMWNPVKVTTIDPPILISSSPSLNWKIETVTNEKSGINPSIALKGNTVHIAHSVIDGGLKYSKLKNNQWNTETVNKGSFDYLSMDLDSGGNPHIAYHDDSKEDLIYTEWNGISWIPQKVDTKNTGFEPSLKLDKNDHPHIVYVNFTADILKYAEWTGSQWNIQTIDNEYIDSLLTTPSLEIDSQGDPQIAYNGIKNKNDILRYAEWTGSQWNIQTVIRDDQRIGPPSLELDSNNNPHIALTQASGLKYIKKTGNTWTQQKLTDNIWAFGAKSLELGDTDNPHIAYQGGSINTNLSYTALESSDKPSPPYNLTVNATGKNYVNLTWSASNDTLSFADPQIQKYSIYKGKPDGAKSIIYNTDKLAYNDTVVVSGETYEYYITAVNKFGESEKSNNITVTLDSSNQPPDSVFTFSPNNPNVEEKVSFDASGSTDPDGNIQSYKWDFDGDGKIETSSQNPIVSHTYQNSGTYTVKLIVTDDDGATNSVTGQLTVSRKQGQNQLPTASFTFSPSNPNVSENVNFDASASTDSDGNITRYMWDFDGDGTTDITSVNTLISHTYQSSGTYTVKLTIKDNDGSTDSTTQQLTVSKKQQKPKSIIDQYDQNNNNNIEGSEVRKAIRCFLFSGNSCINNELSGSDIRKVIKDFLF